MTAQRLVVSDAQRLQVGGGAPGDAPDQGQVACVAGHGSDLLAQWPRADGAATHPWAHSVAPGVADLPDNVIEFDEPLRRQPDLDLDRGVVAAKVSRPYGSQGSMVR